MGSGFFIAHHANDRATTEFQGPLLDGGPEFYGIMWLLFEQLMDSPSHILDLSQIRGIAHQCFTTPERIKAFLASAVETGLFRQEGDDISSPALEDRVAASDDALPNKRIKTAVHRVSKRRAISETSYTEEFEAFWSAYPRLEGKVTAFEQFNNNLKAGATAAEMINAAKVYDSSRDKTKELKFTLLPTTFLGSSQRWKDFRSANARLPATVIHIRLDCPVCGAPEPEGTMQTCSKCGFDLLDRNDPKKVVAFKQEYDRPFDKRDSFNLMGKLLQRKAEETKGAYGEKVS